MNIPFPFPCRALLFDLDGTLVDSAPDLGQTMNYVLTRYGYPPLSLDQVRQYVGNGARFLLARGMFGLEAQVPEGDPTFESAVRCFLDHYHDHLTDDSPPYPGCFAMLDILAARGFRLAVVTNKPEPLARKMLSNLKMAHYFEQVVGGDSLSERKPHPLPLRHTLERLEASPEASLMIGDSETDALSARAAGCGLVLVSHGYNRGIPVDQLNPDRVIDSLEELPALLTPV